jgi:ribonuclease HII
MNLLENRRRIAVVGIDEAGRGPLAGPVTAAAIVLPYNRSFSGLTDSKKVSEQKRETLYAQLTSEAIAYSVVSLGPEEIDQHNIREATRIAMVRAAAEVARSLPDTMLYLLIDGNMNIPTNLIQEFVIKGDEKIATISAASILAKVSRDRLMKEFAEQYPQYGFATHKGYPTKFHREQIRHFGPCAIHRRSFSGVREYLRD